MMKKFLKKGIVLAVCFSMLFVYAGIGAGRIKVYADDSATVTFNGLTITADDGNTLSYGTAAGAEYDVYTTSNIIYIQTERPLTVSGSTTTTALAIVSGKHANLTFNGVSINYASAPPVNVLPNASATADAQRTSLHLTLADGSTNSINTTGASFSGIHVPYGSILTIDDSVKNWGDVEGGRIVGEKDENGIAKPSWLMDSANPGALSAIGGQDGACIGGNNGENSGRIIINGGKITVNSYTNGTSSSSGAGIGGGNTGGAGCLLDGGGIIINGGNIDATASYHGAGIGTGWNCKTAGVGHNGKVTGDITVNGGYIVTKGMGHGNALGGACNAQELNNVGHGNASTAHQIVITGGTLIPNRNSTESWTYQLGAAGGDIIVLGGSFPLNDRSTTSGYDITGAKIQSSDGSALTMVKIMIGAMEGVAVGDRIYNFTVTVDGKPLNVDYGLANKVTDDKTLYFWIPESAKGHSVSISNVTLMKNDGTLIKAEYPFSLPEVGTGDGVTKRWVTFDVDTTEFSEKLKGYLYKKYDGLGWDQDILAEEIVAQEIVLPEPAGKKVDDAEALEFTSVRVKDWFGNATSDESTTGEISTTGTYTITANYNKFKNDPDFSQSFWGHQTTLESIISPATSRIVNLKAESTWQDDDHSKFATITLTADVLPGKGEALTCAAPDGKVQFYINGVKVGKPVDVHEVTKVTKAKAKLAAIADGDQTLTDYDGYAHSNATITLDFTKDQAKYPIPELKDGKFQIEAEYLGGTNFSLAEEKATVTEETSPDKFPFATPPTPTPDGSGENAIVPDKYEVEENEEDGSVILHGYAKDSITKSVSSVTEIVTVDELKELFKDRYDFININSDTAIDTEIENFEIQDKDGNVVTEIDMSKAATYKVIATVFDKASNYKTTLTVDYNLVRVDIDTDGDGKPDVNVDTDGDGKPDINIDTDGDNIPDVNIDKDGDDKPDINIVDKDGDGKPDTGIEPDPDDPIKPDVNIDTDGDGEPDVNIDTDGDGKPDVNIVDKDGDGKPDTGIDNTDPDNPVKPDVNVDTDGDGKPDVNIDTDGDGKPDVNIVDKDGDGKPDTDIDDTDPDNPVKPDVNVDTDGDGKPDVNIDTDGDGKPDVDIVDKDGDGKPDKDIDNTDPKNPVKPDINVDTDGDGKPDVNIDTDGDGKPDVNIVDKDGDGKPDKDIDNTDPKNPVKPDLNIDTDGDGKADLNIDKDGDGKPDLNIDKDGDGKADLNIDADGDGIADYNIDTDGDGIADKNLLGVEVKLPKTGDSIHSGLYIAMAEMIISALGIVLFVRKRKASEM